MTATVVQDKDPKMREPKRKTHAELWIEKVDPILDLHRSRFLFREPSQEELAIHKTGIELAIQTGLSLSAVMENPEVSLRLQLLMNAFNLFHNPKISEDEAEQLLNDLFPE